MKTKNINNFTFIAISVFLFAGAVITLSLPTIISYKQKAVDNLMKQAETAEKNHQFIEQRALLEQANLIGISDPRPLEKLANYFLSVNRADLALTTYNRMFSKDYTRLGNTAINAQRYDFAEKSFKRALSKNLNGENLSGLAIAQFNLGKFSEGCANSEKAIHLNLNDERAARAKQICDLLSSALDKEHLSRESAYQLIDNKVIKIGERSLKNSSDKTPTDYLILAQIDAARGDFKEAINNAKSGLEIDGANIALNQILLFCYREKGDNANAEKQQTILDNLILHDI